MITEIRLGDSYPLKFELKYNGDLVIPTAISDVEITLGYTSKKYSDNEITYDSTNKLWCYPLTLAETIDLNVGEYPAEVRVKFTDGKVIGSFIPFIEVRESLSKDVL